MHRSSHPSVRGACSLDIGFHHMFNALCCVAFGGCIHHAVRFSLCIYTDASPGVGSLVGRELTQSLGARLLVSVLLVVGAICNLYNICVSSTLDNQMHVYIVLFGSTVIFAAVVSYDFFSFQL